MKIDSKKLTYYRQSQVKKLSVIDFRTITENRELLLIKGVRDMVLKTTFNNSSAIYHGGSVIKL